MTTNELQDSKYGIVCLTPENVLAPWIHFEAGALSKTLDSRVSALMINVVTSEIQGPLSRFQATKLDKDDFYKLLTSINEASDNPIGDKVLQKSFDAIWDKMYENIVRIIEESVSRGENVSQNNEEKNAVLEELLQLMRKQDSIISNPEKLLPLDYLEYANRKITQYRNGGEVYIDIIDRIATELAYMYEAEEVNKESIATCYQKLIYLAQQARCEKRYIRYLKDKYIKMIEVVSLESEKRDIDMGDEAKKTEQDC